VSEPLYTRAAIARDAELAAERYRLTGSEQHNPHPLYTDAALAWAASYKQCKQALLSDVESAA
jgi:hypothetical protein